MNNSLNPSCAEFQKGRLLQFAYGELLPREMEIIRRHLASCPDCRAAAEAVAAVRAAAGEPILQENPPAAFDVKLRAAAREGRGRRPGPAERTFGWLRQPRLVSAAAGVAALLVIAGLAWHFWSSYRIKPQDLDPASLVALAEEVDGWQAPVLEAAAPDRTPLEELERQLGELSPKSQVDFEAWYRELNQGGFREIERGFRELDSGVRYL